MCRHCANGIFATFLVRRCSERLAFSKTIRQSLWDSSVDEAGSGVLLYRAVGAVVQ